MGRRATKWQASDLRTVEREQYDDCDRAVQKKIERCGINNERDTPAFGRMTRPPRNRPGIVQRRCGKHAHPCPPENACCNPTNRPAMSITDKTTTIITTARAEPK